MEPGIVTEINFLQSSKAPFLMVATELGIVTEDNSVHCKNAMAPINVTELGISSVDILLFIKANASIVITVDGISMEVFAAGQASKVVRLLLYKILSTVVYSGLAGST
jgi:hypothetical protein